MISGARTGIGTDERGRHSFVSGEQEFGFRSLFAKFVRCNMGTDIGRGCSRCVSQMHRGWMIPLPVQGKCGEDRVLLSSNFRHDTFLKYSTQRACLHYVQHSETSAACWRKGGNSLVRWLVPGSTRTGRHFVPFLPQPKLFWGEMQALSNGTSLREGKTRERKLNGR